jgi:hypothetical protein
MTSTGNTRTMPHSRALITQRVAAGETAAAVAFYRPRGIPQRLDQADGRNDWTGIRSPRVVLRMNANHFRSWNRSAAKFR